MVATVAALMKQKINPVRYKTNVNIELDTILQILIAETRVAGDPEGNYSIESLMVLGALIKYPKLLINW